MKRLVTLLMSGSILLLSTTGWRVSSHNRPSTGDQPVGRERQVIPGFDEPNTPPNVAVSDQLRAAITDPAAIEDGQLNLNRAVYVRFFSRQRSAPPQAIVILVPGILGGANVFRVLATQIVMRSAGEIEVWAVDRRASLLEDAAAMMAAETAHTAEAAMGALDSYMNDPAGEGGYVANHPVEVSRFMSEWGLDVHLRDLKAIVERARLSVDGARPKVLLGGHDFVGADLAALFVAYNFEGIAGFSMIDGLILLDGTPSVAASPRAPQIRSDDEYLNTGLELLGTLRVPGLNQLRHPEVSGEPPFVVGEEFSPFSFQLVEVIAQLALFAPDEASPLPDDLAPSVPSTNAATLALNIDDEFALQAQRRFSVGFLRIPAGRSFQDVATPSPDPDRANPNGLFIPRDLGRDMAGNPLLQQWDDLGDLSAIGLRGAEVSNMSAVARNFFYGGAGGSIEQGEANFIEWFFPRRLLLDILLAARLDTSALSAEVISAITERGGNRLTVTENRRVNVPVLARSAGEGIFAGETKPLPTPFAFFPYRNSIASRTFDGDEVSGYAHNDIVASSDPLVADVIIEFISSL